jgi:MGT family glycosyltransferase
MKILLASMPFDGHFNPLVTLALHLDAQGHDVRFYAGPSYVPRLERLGLRVIPFERALEVNSENLVQVFPEYERLGSGPKAIAFALTKIFFGNTEAHFSDIEALREDFHFDAVVCDAAFFAGYLVAHKLRVPTYGVATAPTPAPTSPTSPPPFFGLRPARNVLQRLQHRVMRSLVESGNREGMGLFEEVLRRQGLPPFEGSAFDLPVAAARVLFQVGVSEMDFPRDDWPQNFQFVGALGNPPVHVDRPDEYAYAKKRGRYPFTVVVSQGTLDNRDPTKLIVPTLEALKDAPYLVVACVGRANVTSLRERFPQENVVIEDFVPFDVLFAETDAFVGNGGYGSVVQAMVHGVPVVAAGKLEGKCDVNARLSYRGLGIDLRTERPKPRQIRAAVERVLHTPSYAENAARVRDELRRYDSARIIEERLVSDFRRALPASMTRSA